MPVIFQNAFFNHLYELLSALYDADSYDYAYDWEEYPALRDELVTALADNVTLAVQFINSLDFNNQTDEHLLNFIPDVVDKLTTFGDKVVLASCLDSVADNNPQLNLGGLKFHTILSMGSHLDGSL